VLVCRACDRAQRYCPDGCAEAARAERQREAAARHRRTRRARFANARRQAGHRSRRREEVTHRSSPAPLEAAQRWLLLSWLIGELEAALGTCRTNTAAPRTALHCTFCGALLDPKLRSSFLGRRLRWRARARAP